MGCFDGYSSSMMSVLWEKLERKSPPDYPVRCTFIDAFDWNRFTYRSQTLEHAREEFPGTLSHRFHFPTIDKAWSMANAKKRKNKKKIPSKCIRFQTTKIKSNYTPSICRPLAYVHYAHALARLEYGRHWEKAAPKTRPRCARAMLDAS